MHGGVKWCLACWPLALLNGVGQSRTLSCVVAWVDVRWCAVMCGCARWCEVVLIGVGAGSCGTMRDSAGRFFVASGCAAGCGRFILVRYGAKQCGRVRTALNGVSWWRVAREECAVVPRSAVWCVVVQNGAKPHAPFIHQIYVLCILLAACSRH